MCLTPTSLPYLHNPVSNIDRNNNFKLQTLSFPIRSLFTKIASHFNRHLFSQTANTLSQYHTESAHTIHNISSHNHYKLNNKHTKSNSTIHVVSNSYENKSNRSYNSITEDKEVYSLRVLRTWRKLKPILRGTDPYGHKRRPSTMK